MSQPTSRPTLARLHGLTLALAAGMLLSSGAQAAAPGTVIRDCKNCPELVVLPAGSFSMGTAEGEVGRQPDEGPQHEVTFKRPIAISRFQVLKGEWDVYLRDSGYRMPSGDEREGRQCIAGIPRYKYEARNPAVCLDFNEAQAYIQWLSKKTGKQYFMPSEALREYAARGGSKGPFPFPLDPDKEYSIALNANTYGPADGFANIAPAGSFKPNAFGVYDMHGNVSEFTPDCYRDSYEGAPNDGSAWTETGCKVLSMRGNDWIEPPIFSRSGNRNATIPSDRGDWLSFRVAREL